MVRGAAGRLRPCGACILCFQGDVERKCHDIHSMSGGGHDTFFMVAPQKLYEILETGVSFRQAVKAGAIVYVLTWQLSGKPGHNFNKKTFFTLCINYQCVTMYENSYRPDKIVSKTLIFFGKSVPARHWVSRV